jgi:hypothetical protein
VFKRFKALADKKKTIVDEDLLALVGDEVHQPEVVWEIIDLQVRGGAAAGQAGCGIVAGHVVRGLTADTGHTMPAGTTAAQCVEHWVRSCMAASLVCMHASLHYTRGHGRLHAAAGALPPMLRAMLHQVMSLTLLPAVLPCAGGVRHHGHAHSHSADEGTRWHLADRRRCGHRWVLAAHMLHTGGASSWESSAAATCIVQHAVAAVCACN